jgi:hypothetical protein
MSDIFVVCNEDAQRCVLGSFSELNKANDFRYNLKNTPTVIYKTTVDKPTDIGVFIQKKDDEIFVVCNTGYEEREFLCVFSDIENARNYVSRKWGQFDNIVIYRHVVNSKKVGDIEYEQKCALTRNSRSH